ncbi:MAG: NAD(P)-dependent oxidoreductase [Hyphomicrobiaceae bacterium]|nr:MAG: NAD(P)-dependent oxidoreductase [Hyphomicrobiaceae bacterium]
MKKIGFVGVGVMGEPMCRNLALKSGLPVLALDRNPAPLARLRPHGVAAATGLAELAQDCELIFLALPSGKHVESICLGEEGLCALARRGQIVVDLGTSPVALARRLAELLRDKGGHFADAPIARTRQAAEDGTLSIMVGADELTFEAVRPLLACFASDITHCGPAGAGQIVKILNNMVLIQTVVALSEAIAVARRSGLDGRMLFETLAKGSADSFALRNHGMKAILPGSFPEQAFSAEYALKDLGYALDLAREAGLDLAGAAVGRSRLEEAIEAGHGKQYWPVICKVIDSAQ